jgi:predicted RecB family endonuclease
MSFVADTVIEDASLQVLEVRAAECEPAVTITAAIAVGAIQAMFTALTEQLDREAQAPSEKAEDVLALREQTALIERLRPLAAADAHAVVSLSQAELGICLRELAQYVGRADREGYQPPDLRDRLRVIERILPILRDAETEAATAAAAARQH